MFYAVSAECCKSCQWSGSQDLEISDYSYIITWEKYVPNEVLSEGDASGSLASGLLRRHCIALFTSNKLFLYGLFHIFVSYSLLNVNQRIRIISLYSSIQISLEIYIVSDKM